MKATFTKLSLWSIFILCLSMAHSQILNPLSRFGTTTLAGSALNQFDNPTSVFTDTEGKIYIADKNNSRICVWSLSGNTYLPLTTFGGYGSGTNELDSPTGVVKASNGYIYVTDNYNQRISVWTQSGNTFGHLTNFGDGTVFNSPQSVKLNANDQIFVADYYNNRISVWTHNGTNFGELTSFGSIGSGINEFNQPVDIEIMSDGKILVADAGNNRIAVWTQTGSSFTALTTFGVVGSDNDQLSSPWSISATTGNFIYIADLGNQRVSVWSVSGLTFSNTTIIGTTGTSGSGDDQFSDPSGVFITSNNTLYVADLYNHRVSVWQACNPPQVLAQSASQTICGGNLAALSVTATGTALTYKWWELNNPTTPVSTLVGFQTSVGGQYFAQVIGSCGSIYSNVITNITSNPVTAITKQPISQIICGNSTATLNVSASGDNLSYLWSNGATTASINTSVVGSYIVTVIGTCGNSISNSANVANGGASTQIVAQPTSQTLCAGVFANFGVTATGSNLTYLWSNGANTSTLQTSVAGNYLVTVSGTCGSLVSNTVQLTVTPYTSIISITSGIALPQGITTTLNVLATGSQLSYLWSTGATTPSITGVGPGEYDITISGTCGVRTTRSFVASLAIGIENSLYKHVDNFAGNLLQKPNDITIANGMIYITEEFASQVSVWTYSGNNFTSLTRFGSFGFELGELYSPFGVRVGSDGKIFVVETGGNRVSVFSRSGNEYSIITTFAGLGSEINQLDGPNFISIGRDRRIYISDNANHRVSVWTQSGNNFTNITTFGDAATMGGPSGLAFTSDGKILVADYLNGRVSIWSQNGNTYTNLGHFGSLGNGRDQLKTPLGMFVANDKKIYVADAGNFRISVWTQTGNTFGILTTFGEVTRLEDINQVINMPSSLYVYDNGRILITDKSPYGYPKISVWQAPAPIVFWQATFDVTAPTTFTGNTATLTWPTVSGLNNVKYCIRISKDRGLGSGVKTICGLTGNTYTYNPNDPNTRTEAGLEDFFWQVAAQDSAGNLSQWSEIQTFALNASATSIDAMNSTPISYFPNPLLGNELNIEGLFPGESIQILNTFGHRIINTISTGEKVKIDFGLFPSGVYNLMIRNKAYKVVKQ